MTLINAMDTLITKFLQSYLNKHSLIGVGMRIDGPGRTLPTHAAGKATRMCHRGDFVKRHQGSVNTTRMCHRGDFVKSDQGTVLSSIDLTLSEIYSII